MSKYTPGPWKVGAKFDTGSASTSGVEISDIENSETVAVAVEGNDSGGIYTYQEVLANARLIAAAPELLEALINGAEIANRVYQMGDAEVRRALVGIYELNRAAIAKAEGK